MDNLDYNSLISAVIGFFGAIIGAIVGGLVSYYGSYKLNEKQSKDELKNIAKALDNDIYTISKSVNFETFYKLYKKGGTKIPEKIDQKFIDDKTTIYSVFKSDIAKYDYHLFSEIYEFYNDLFTAESCRLFVLQNKDSNDKFTQTEVEIYYNLMRLLIIKCGDKIQEISDKLKNVYKS